MAIVTKNMTTEIQNLDQDNIPRHVAIIMDGNGRWASKRLQPRLFGHKAGVAALKRAIDYAIQAGIDYLSAWAFATANWKRPETEVSGLMSLLKSTLKNDIDEFHEKNIRLRVVGFFDDLDPDLVTLIRQSEDKTKLNDGLTLIIQFNYDGRRDILQAIQNCTENHDNPITEDILTKYTLMGPFPEPELMIRTSNVIRLSNYMMWQLTFTELVFLEKNWPDFTQDDFHKAVLSYQQLDRNFGHVSGSLKKIS